MTLIGTRHAKTTKIRVSTHLTDSLIISNELRTARENIRPMENFFKVEFVCKLMINTDITATKRRVSICFGR